MTTQAIDEVATLRAQKDALERALAKIRKIAVNELTKKTNLDHLLSATTRGIALDDIRVIAKQTVKANHPTS